MSSWRKKCCHGQKTCCLRDNIMDTFWCIASLSHYKNIGSTCLVELLRCSFRWKIWCCQLSYTTVLLLYVRNVIWPCTRVFYTTSIGFLWSHCNRAPLGFGLWALRNVFFGSILVPNAPWQFQDTNISASVEHIVELTSRIFLQGWLIQCWYCVQQVGLVGPRTYHWGTGTSRSTTM